MSLDFVACRKVESAKPFLDIQNLTVKIPEINETIIRNFSLRLEEGESFVLFGDSGSGKSSIVRLLRELRHEGSGEIIIGGNPSDFTLAQETQIPQGDLRSVLCWPQSNEGQYSNLEMQESLSNAGLTKLARQFSNEADPKHLASLYKPYAKKMAEEWHINLSSLSEKQRQILFNKLTMFVQENAENFYPAAVADQMNKLTKTELAHEIVQVLKQPLEVCEQSKTMSLRFLFPGNLKSLALNIVRHALQASSTELMAATMDGMYIRDNYSGGEKQRVGWAQLFLQQPKIAILDEPTSKQDPDSTNRLYGLAKTLIPNTIIFAISHDHSVARHFTYSGILKDSHISVIKNTPPPRPTSIHLVKHGPDLPSAAIS